MNTPEMELIANDPLNPGLGYIFRTSVNGQTTGERFLEMKDALEIIRDAMIVALEKGEPIHT